MKSTLFITLKWTFTIVFIWLLNNNKCYFVECATKASHFLRHHQHTVGSVPWKSRDELTDVNANKTDLMVHQREDAKIICELTNSSAIAKEKLRWFHNGLEIDFGHRYSKDTRTGHITIINVHFEDGGLWHCQDRDSGLMGNPVHVIVLEEPKSPYLLIDGRRLDPGNLFIPIRENNDLSVECIVEGGNPKPKLTWLLVPSSNNIDVNTGVITVPSLQVSNESSVSENAAVHLFRSEAKLPKVLRAHHNSTIICLVNHVTLQNPINTSILLDVQYTPSFGISRVPGFGFPITEGISVSLKCDVDSNPVSNPIWQKDNDVPPTEQSNDGYLNFTSIRIEDSGWYKCITRYQLAEYSSIGYFLNVREARNQAMEEETPEELAEEGSALEVTLGGEVQLECPAGSVSCWGRSKYPGQHLEPLGPGPKLTLGNVVYQEAGEYKCFVGRTSKMEKWRSRSVQVNVVGSPIVYPANKTITAIINQRVTFSLEFCANPPVTRAFWIRESKSLSPGVVIEGLIAHNITESNTKHCQKAELTINSVQVENNGEYMFVVASERGLAGATIMLNVTVITPLSEDNLVKATHSGTSGQRSNSKFTALFLAINCNFILIYIFTLEIFR
ncbi:hemicentin-2 [Planococcus citri]|uniref:hemicentin-2 n=1 Tax=Planococcus citri TaxID=170843 RepID=UPI0031FA2BB3